MALRNSSVLVTGGCGFIGVNLVSMLLDEGARVRVVDNLSVGTREALGGHLRAIDLVEADVRSLEALNSACRGVEVVFHLAAQPGVIPSILDPEPDFAINAGGTFNALLAAHRQGAAAFVFASSNAAVGEFSDEADETTAPRPLSPYGAAKLAGEAYCSAFAGAYGMHTVSLRFANAYGPHSGHKQSVIARFIQRVLNNEDLTIYGDGQQIRDFIHVEDICRAMLLAAESGLSGEIVHTASGRGTSVLELVRVLEEVVGRDLPVVSEPRREGEAFRIAPSVEKARRVLGFEARVALAEGVAGTYEWFRRELGPEAGS